MAHKTTFAAAAGLAALLSLAGAAHAATSTTVVIQAGASRYHAQPLHPAQYQPPPPPRYERVPPPRRGLLWSQGHWEWRGHRHAWVPGHWVRARHGAAYRQPYWQQRGSQWIFVAGGWTGSGAAHSHAGRHDYGYR